MLAALTMDNVLPYIPSAVATSFPHSARPAHNISPVAPTFSPERLQEKCHLLTPDDEVTSKSFETDLPSQRVTFLTDSRLWGQIRKHTLVGCYYWTVVPFNTHREGICRIKFSSVVLEIVDVGELPFCFMITHSRCLIWAHPIH
ncbi:uncharacterized protein LOC132616497 [Lycium barbarum]|uniref:uncharacterized protein LOC132616497 n=1 Tax=Lycium barbarum TaxID=112863 RepID=UPI00293E33A2|nr:uncharacterized protein LOC132616497 [Lycium barbarum]XP_060186911.1 uncharacterized protein LOC132616497 [Lycium barbarum]